MSQIVTRKGPVGEDKDKRQTDSPVKEMKKKIAANAEKEKQAAEKSTEKSEKSTHSEKKPEKAAEKADKQDKPAEKSDKKDKLDKSIDKKDKLDKSVDKKDKLDKSSDKKDKLDKSIEKKDKTEKSGDKKEAEKKENAVEKESTSEQKEGEEKKEDKSMKEKDGKMETDEKSKKPEPKAKENGAKVNGEQNGDTVKAARTPETPRPASDKHKDSDKDYVPDDSKLLKLKEEVPCSDRKLRSADSPKPHEKKDKPDTASVDSANKVLIPVVVIEETNINEHGKEKDTEEKEGEKETNSAEEKTEREIEVVVEIENEDEGRVKADTNYSKSRVKVSPYRRSARLADHTNTSLLANYTGNNTTMEMDITETSSFISEEPESPYLSGLRSIRGRRSYKPLREMTLRNIGINRSTRSTTSTHTVTVTEHPTRPTGTVVGRKRKPSREELADAAATEEAVRSKRARLLERLAKPFRLASTPLPARRAAEIVGINTDLPLSAPVALTETFDPESIKPASAISVDPPTPITPTSERDSKRCVVM